MKKALYSFLRPYLPLDYTKIIIIEVFFVKLSRACCGCTTFKDFLTLRVTAVLSRVFICYVVAFLLMKMIFVLSERDQPGLLGSALSAMQHQATFIDFEAKSSFASTADYELYSQVLRGEQLTCI